MFPDTKIASQMRLKHTKACYITNFWIAPHFVSVLNHESRKSVIYFLSFNETLNKTTLEFEMDFLIRFWDETDNDVKVSLFLTYNNKRLKYIISLRRLLNL